MDSAKTGRLWQPVGAFEPLASIVVPSGGLSQIVFGSIPQTHTHLQIRAFCQTNRGTYGRDLVKVNINSDGGSNYAYHQLAGYGGSPDVQTNSAGSGNVTEIYPGEVGTTTGGNYGTFISDFLDYTNVNKFKTMRSLWGGDHNGTIAGYGGSVGLFSGLWRNSNAITSITIAPVNGSLFSANSSFALYGIK